LARPSPLLIRLVAFAWDAIHGYGLGVIHPGTVEHGMVVLPPDAKLPEGPEVEVIAADAAPGDDPFDSIETSALWLAHLKHMKIGWRSPMMSARKSISMSGMCMRVMASRSHSWPPHALLSSARKEFKKSKLEPITAESICCS
jgi:hypothetical protein